MKSKRISIKQKVGSANHKSQFIMDYLDAICTVDVKSFQAEVSIIQNKYLHGNPEIWNASYIRGEIIKTYNNMSEDGTWKKELGEKDQILHLALKLRNSSQNLTKNSSHLQLKRPNKLLLMLVAAEVALAAGKGTVIIPFQHGFRLRKRTKLSTMEKNTIGALEITTAAVLNTMECMLITRLAITMSGDPKWMKVILPGIKARNLTRHPLNLQMIQIKS
jgi:hypothetical protein